MGASVSADSHHAGVGVGSGGVSGGGSRPLFTPRGPFQRALERQRRRRFPLHHLRKKILSGVRRPGSVSGGSSSRGGGASPASAPVGPPGGGTYDRVFRELTARWSVRDLAALCEEYERQAAIREVAVAAGLARPSAPGLRADLAHLLESGAGADVILLYAGKEFPAHRSILCARCPFFARLLGEYPLSPRCCDGQNEHHGGAASHQGSACHHANNVLGSLGYGADSYTASGLTGCRRNNSSSGSPIGCHSRHVGDGDVCCGGDSLHRVGGTPNQCSSHHSSSCSSEGCRHRGSFDKRTVDKCSCAVERVSDVGPVKVPVTIQTPGVDAGVFEALLRYFYTGEVTCASEKGSVKDGVEAPQGKNPSPRWLMARLSREFGAPGPLEADLKDALETGQHSDTVLSFNKGPGSVDPDSRRYGDVKCHKAVLMARSPFLRNLLTRQRTSVDLQSSRDGLTRIVLEDSVISHRYSRVLLKLLYQDILDLSLIVKAAGPSSSLYEAQAIVAGKSNMSTMEEAMELHHVGRYLEIPVLVEGCEDIIAEGLAPSNLSSVLAWSAEPHGSDWVHRQALQFLHDDFLSVTRAPGGNSALYRLSASHLVSALKSPYVQASELDLLSAVMHWSEYELLRRIEGREPNLVSHTAHSISRKGIRKKDLNEVELRAILCPFLPLLRMDHVIPRSSPILSSALKRGLVSCPPSYMLTGSFSEVSSRAWLGSKSQNSGAQGHGRSMSACVDGESATGSVFVWPRLFMPFYQSAKVLLREKQAEGGMHHAVYRARHRSITSLPESSLMADLDLRAVMSSTPASGGDYSSGCPPPHELSFIDNDTLQSLAYRVDVILRTEVVGRSFLAPESHAEVYKQVCLWAVRERCLPDYVSTLLMQKRASRHITPGNISPYDVHSLSLDRANCSGVMPADTMPDVALAGEMVRSAHLRSSSSSSSPCSTGSCGNARGSAAATRHRSGNSGIGVAPDVTGVGKPGSGAMPSVGGFPDVTLHSISSSEGSYGKRKGSSNSPRLPPSPSPRARRRASTTTASDLTADSIPTGSHLRSAQPSPKRIPSENETGQRTPFYSSTGPVPLGLSDVTSSAPYRPMGVTADLVADLSPVTRVKDRRGTDLSGAGISINQSVGGTPNNQLSGASLSEQNSASPAVEVLHHPESAGAERSSPRFSTSLLSSLSAMSPSRSNVTFPFTARSSRSMSVRSTAQALFRLSTELDNVCIDTSRRQPSPPPPPPPPPYEPSREVFKEPHANASAEPVASPGVVTSSSQVSSPLAVSSLIVPPLDQRGTQSHSIITSTKSWDPPRPAIDVIPPVEPPLSRSLSPALVDQKSSLTNVDITRSQPSLCVNSVQALFPVANGEARLFLAECLHQSPPCGRSAAGTAPSSDIDDKHRLLSGKCAMPTSAASQVNIQSPNSARVEEPDSFACARRCNPLQELPSCAVDSLATSSVLYPNTTRASPFTDIVGPMPAAAASLNKIAALLTDKHLDLTPGGVVGIANRNCSDVSGAVPLGDSGRGNVCVEEVGVSVDGPCPPDVAKPYLFMRRTSSDSSLEIVI